jgi:hypothetical protein
LQVDTLHTQWIVRNPISFRQALQNIQAPPSFTDMAAL